jgi:hypothetical protein
MNSYQKEQLEALALVQAYLSNLALDARQALESQVADYLLFRDDVDAFLDAGYSSSLMYTHNSPGLLRIKKQAQKSKK